MMRLYLCTLFSIVVSACGQISSQSSLNTAFDEMNIRLLSLEQRNSNKLYAAVGTLMSRFEDPENPGKYFVYSKCSGVQISPKHILSAAHCDGPNLIFSKTQIATEETRNDLSVTVFGDLLRLTFTGELIDAAAKAKNNDIAKAIVYKNTELDFIIYEFSSGLDDNFIELPNTDFPMTDLSDLAVIAHPHGVPLSIADNCSGKLKDGYIYQRCDTLTGSSGGLVIDRKSNTPIGIQLAGNFINSGVFYENMQRFESAEESARVAGCADDDLDCIKNLITNKDLALSRLSADLMHNASEVFALLKGQKP